MNGSRILWAFVAAWGLLLFWRMAITTKFLPLGGALRLYQESARTLRRNRWIILVYLCGQVAGLVVTGTGRILAGRIFRDQMNAQFDSMEGMPIPWEACVYSAAGHVLPTAASWTWAKTLSGSGLWLAAILLFAFRRRLVAQVLPESRFAPETLRYLKRLLLGRCWRSMRPSRLP